MSKTKQEYAEMVKGVTPNSPILKNCSFAFLIGGAICAVGQIIMNIYMSYGLDTVDASSATSITMIFLGALFTGLKVYDNLAKVAGAGTLVPITGFANSIVSPALEYKSEGYVLGMSAKMFTIAGPVLVFGISASIIYGIIIWLFRLF